MQKRNLNSIFKLLNFNSVRDKHLEQGDTYLAQRDAYLAQRDAAIGQVNMMAQRLAQIEHRADVVVRPAAARPDRVILFLHLAKTGGMTLAEILARGFATNQFLKIDMENVEPAAMGTWSHRAIEKALAKMQKAEIDDLRAVWGHYRYGVQSALPKQSAVVTILRDPIDRWISAYYYANGQDALPLSDLAARMNTKNANTPKYDLGFDNYMTRMLSGLPALNPDDVSATTDQHRRLTDDDFKIAADNLDSCLLVGLTDQFEEMLIVLGYDLGWSLSDLVYRRVNKTNARPKILEVPAVIRDTILGWNSYDSALVERARAHLARRIAGYPGDFQKDLTLFRKLNKLYRQGVDIEDLRRVEYEERA